ncbi:helix-turn-helix transcriptional regulator [Paenibacillus oryzisoli]|uniref:helix-turn-helix domain-containing protein n=1 Tax=Paenibacillus oryzisoli TaxID=1850517 RepID=UPI003D2719A2
MLNVEDILYAVIGQRIRINRERFNMTQEEMGEKVGLTRSSIANIELGRQKIQLDTLYQVAITLNLEILELLPSINELEKDENDNIQFLLEQDKFTEEQLSWILDVIKKGIKNEGEK